MLPNSHEKWILYMDAAKPSFHCITKCKSKISNLCCCWMVYTSVNALTCQYTWFQWRGGWMLCCAPHHHSSRTQTSHSSMADQRWNNTQSLSYTKKTQVCYLCLAFTFSFCALCCCLSVSIFEFFSGLCKREWIWWRTLVCEGIALGFSNGSFTLRHHR